ncbi:MAG: ABC transporter permease [Planctomycetaceae bacterium]
MSRETFRIPAPGSPVTARSRSGRGRLVLPTELWLLLANVLVFLAVYAGDPRRSIATANSLQMLTADAALLGLFAIGMTVVIISGGIDLSVGTVIAFASVVFTMVVRGLVPAAQLPNKVGGVTPGVLLFATLVTLTASLLVGLLHGGLINLLRIPPFIATLGTLIGLRSACRLLAQWAQGSDKISLSAPLFRALYNTTVDLPLPWLETPLKLRWIPLLLFALVAIAVGVLMTRTVAGRHLYALGGNEQAARLSGIRTGRLRILAYMVCSGCAGLAGILYASREGQGNSVNLGVGYELNAIAAAVVGGTSLRGGVGTITGTILGAIFLTLVINGIGYLIKIDASLYEGLLVGLVVIKAVAVNQVRQWRGRS